MCVRVRPWLTCPLKTVCCTLLLRFPPCSVGVAQVLGIVDENFAAGVLYAIDNTYNETTNVLVYNMGASSTQVSIHSHDSYPVRVCSPACAVVGLVLSTVPALCCCRFVRPHAVLCTACVCSPARWHALCKWVGPGTITRTHPPSTLS